MEFIYWLFDDSNFFTRDRCGDWTEELKATYQLANALIALAYFAIPLSLTALYFKVRKLKHLAHMNPVVILLFVSFIFLCGLTHLGHVIVFRYAPYRLFALLDLLTAIVSLIVAILLPMIIYDFMNKINERISSDEHTK